MKYTGALWTIADMKSSRWWAIVGPTGFRDVFFINVVLTPYVYDANMILKIEHRSHQVIINPVRTVKNIVLTLNYMDIIELNPSCSKFLKPLQEGWDLRLQKAEKEEVMQGKLKKGPRYC